MTQNPIPEQVEEMVRTWAEHAAVPFQGMPRSREIERAIRTSILLAFGVLNQMQEKFAAPTLKATGVKFGYAWDADNRIRVAVAPKDELTDDMMVLGVDEEFKVCR